MTLTSTYQGLCCKCGSPRDSEQRYCRACFASYARERRKRLGTEEGKRAWTNARSDRNGHAPALLGPSWLAPKRVPQVFATITASIVWGLCGAMADMPDY